MAERVVSTPPTPAPIPSEPEATIAVSADEYMERYAHDHYEWEQGRLVKMSPISDRHDELTGYLYTLLKSYFALNPIGRIKRDPFVLRLDKVNSRRQPDLQIILNDNPGQFTDTAMIGPADICIEVVSMESVERDYGNKFAEYEAGGVREYWLVDPIRAECRLSRLSAEGRYQTQQPDAHGDYQTPLLPGLKFNLPTLWLEQLPHLYTVAGAVKAMLAK